MLNYYDILGVSQSASASEIKTAFKKKALLFHPDKHNGNMEMEEQFKIVNNAYQTLIDPQKRAQYNLLLYYSNASTIHSTYTAPSEYSYQQRRQPAYAYGKPRQKYKSKISWQENMRATLYAILFTMVVGVVCTIVMFSYQFYNHLKEKTLMAERQQLFEKTMALYNQGNFEQALVNINELGSFYENEASMLNFKKGLISEFINKAHVNFEQKNFGEAINFFNILEKHTDLPRIMLLENLALTYTLAKQPEKAIEKYTQLLVMGYRNISVYMNMGLVYKDQLNDPENALKYFNHAHNLSLENLEQTYGKAYAIMLDKKMFNHNHEKLYTVLAELYFLNGNMEKAIKTSSWNINIWPENFENYLTTAKCYEKMGKVHLSCQYYTKAKSLNTELKIKNNCKFN